MTKDEAKQILDDACKVWDALYAYNGKHPSEALFLGEHIQFTGEKAIEIANALEITYTLYPTGTNRGLVHFKYNGYGFFGGWGY